MHASRRCAPIPEGLWRPLPAAKSSALVRIPFLFCLLVVSRIGGSCLFATPRILLGKLEPPSFFGGNFYSGRDSAGCVCALHCSLATTRHNARTGTALRACISRWPGLASLAWSCIGVGDGKQTIVNVAVTRLTISSRLRHSPWPICHRASFFLQIFNLLPQRLDHFLNVVHEPLFRLLVQTISPG